MKQSTRVMALVAALVSASLGPVPALAQGVTTAAVTGIVKDARGPSIPGATVVAVHQPSATTYNACRRPTDASSCPACASAVPTRSPRRSAGSRPKCSDNVSLNLGVAQEVPFTLKVASIAETITVVGTSDPVFSSGRTGAATAVTREELATLPTISGRITDITRLTPQYGGNGSFAGQDNRANNMTVDGSYFNNSFGLGVTTGGIGDRTGVAPISLEAIEQVQVSVAPYDVRQGNFTGAGVNTVTRSGTNKITASVYHRMRNESYVGTEAAGLAVNPGIFDTNTTGVWAGGPIVKNKLFAFGAYEKQSDTRPLTTFRSNPGGAPVGGNTTRVNASDLAGAQPVPVAELQLRDRPVRRHPEEHARQAVDAQGRLQHQQRQQGRVPLQPARLEQRRAAIRIVVARDQPADELHAVPDLRQLELPDSREPQVGRRRVELGVRHHDEQPARRLHEPGREPRSDDQLFPFVVIGDGAGSPFTSFGSEPFTPFNLLFYNTLQVQDSVTMFTTNHSMTFGGAVEKFHSDNSFYFGIQSAYSYNTLADFYADANGYLANPNRTVSPVQLSIFQVKYLLQPGQTTPPLQPLDVVYGGALHPGRVAAASEPDGDGRSARRRADVRQHGVPEPGRPMR